MDAFLKEFKNGNIDIILTLFDSIYITEFDEFIALLLIYYKKGYVYPATLVDTIDAYLEKIENYVLNIPVVYYPRSMLILYHICVIVRYSLNKESYIPKVLYISEYRGESSFHISLRLEYIKKKLSEYKIYFAPDYILFKKEPYSYTTERISILCLNSCYSNKLLLKNIVKLNNSTGINYLEFAKTYPKKFDKIPITTSDFNYISIDCIYFTNVNYYIIDVLADGNCFYNSILTGMYINNYAMPLKYCILTSNITNGSDCVERLDLINRIKKDTIDLLLKDYNLFKISKISNFKNLYNYIADKYKLDNNNIHTHLSSILTPWLNKHWMDEIYPHLNRIILQYILKIKVFVLSNNKMGNYDFMDINYIAVNRKPLTIINYNNIHFKYMHII